MNRRREEIDDIDTVKLSAGDNAFKRNKKDNLAWWKGQYYCVPRLL
jgi:hypothetical protein